VCQAWKIYNYSNIFRIYLTIRTVCFTRNKSFDKLYILSMPFWCQMEKLSGNLFLKIWGFPPINFRDESLFVNKLLQMVAKTGCVPPVNLRSESASIIWMELKYFLKGSKRCVMPLIYKLGDFLHINWFSEEVLS
jgi:hypothetical protein